MNQTRWIQCYHPAVLFVYALAALCFCFASTHPVWVLCSFACAIAQVLLLKGGPATLRHLRSGLWLFLALALFNPLTNHKGLTVLFAIGGLPFTLEAMVMGLCLAGMLYSAFLWCLCYQALITSDRFYALFANIAPLPALMVSMIIQQTGEAAQMYQRIKGARFSLEQAAVGKKERMRQTARHLGALLVFRLEDSMHTADGMRAKGYGVAKRTAFQTYRFTKRDGVALVYILLLSALVLFGLVQSGKELMFFPLLAFPPCPVLSLLAYLLLLCFPLVVEGKEGFFAAHRHTT